MSHMDERKVQACPEYEAVLEDYISDELSGAERESVAAHLQTCSACAVMVESALSGRSILRFAGEAAADPGPFFTRRVMSRIAALEPRAAADAGFWKPLELFARRAVWASAACSCRSHWWPSVISTAGTLPPASASSIAFASLGGL